MKKYILLFLTISLSTTYGKNTASFIVDINDRGMVVTSPSKQQDTASIIIKNNTLDKIVSELRSQKKVLKRFVLRPNGKEVLSVTMKGSDALYFVPLSPPFEAAQLKFKQKVYEIPKKR